MAADVPTQTTEVNVVGSFARAVLAALTALAPFAAIADSANGTQRYYEVRGAKLYTQIYGHGPPVVYFGIYRVGS